jgi:hypothetical protein
VRWNWVREGGTEKEPTTGVVAVVVIDVNEESASEIMGVGEKEGSRGEVKERGTEGEAGAEEENEEMLSTGVELVSCEKKRCDRLRLKQSLVEMSACVRTV